MRKGNYALPKKQIGNKNNTHTHTTNKKILNREETQKVFKKNKREKRKKKMNDFSAK